MPSPLGCNGRAINRCKTFADHESQTGEPDGFRPGTIRGVLQGFALLVAETTPALAKPPATADALVQVVPVQLVDGRLQVQVSVTPIFIEAMK
jgi:hypothetical protein